MAQKKIGLALSGGGARGFAHIGVLKVLADSGVTVDLVAGTSAGSIIGAAVAAGMSANEIEAMSARIGWLDLIRPSMRFTGLLSNAPLGRFVAKNFPASRFEELEIPFSAVAFDLAASSAAVLSGIGDLAEAIRASCAVPGIFAPVRHTDGRLLVDGGVVSPMPVSTARAMGAEAVIAVDLLSCGSAFANEPTTGPGILLRSALSTIRTVSITEQAGADVCIEPPIAHLRPDQIKHREEFIELGEKAAREKLNEIIELVG